LAAQAAYRLNGKFRIAITGTPIENRPEELWSQFQFLMPDLLGDKSTFLATPHPVKKLRVKPFILRRSKEDVQLNLPEKKDLPLWIEMTESQQDLYHDTLGALKSGLLQSVQADGVQAHRFEILAAILRLRQICCDPRLVGGQIPGAKAEMLLSMAEEWASSGKKALVFSQFSTLLRILQTDLQKMGIEPIYLDGSVPAKERGELVARFQEEDKPHLFLLSLKAGGVGLNLTAAQSALLFEPWWNEAVEQQAIDRAHRIGQKNTLWVHRFLTPGAIEEKMLGVKGRKMAFAEEILGDTSEAWSAEDLAQLITSHHN
jgi:SNF2 family DNA or RNA helicase